MQNMLKPVPPHYRHICKTYTMTYIILKPLKTSVNTERLCTLQNSTSRSLRIEYQLLHIHAHSFYFSTNYDSLCRCAAKIANSQPSRAQFLCRYFLTGKEITRTVLVFFIAVQKKAKVCSTKDRNGYNAAVSCSSTTIKRFFPRKTGVRCHSTEFTIHKAVVHKTFVISI
jgi:hypothetical protein